MATIRTCHVTEAIMPIVARSSVRGAATKMKAKGMSKSRTLRSDEAWKTKLLVKNTK